jgi:hypothetical protein
VGKQLNPSRRLKSGRWRLGEQTTFKTEDGKSMKD